MDVQQYSVSYGNQEIVFAVLWVARRTLEIAVHPNGQVVIKAPLKTSPEEAKNRVFRRARWILRQRAYFAQFEPRTSKRHFVSGESHLYLGRQYRLKISKAEQENVKLLRGRFLVGVNGDASTARIKMLLEGWYAQKARIIFSEAFNRQWPCFATSGLPQPQLKIRRMKTRWGSLSRAGTLSLNTDLIRAPKECIDYVLTHELCHLQYHDHGPEFFQLLEKIMPDWAKRKHRLEVTLV